MNAFMIVTAAIKDGAKLREYAQQSGRTIAAHDGNVMVRGTYDRAVVGDAEHSMAVVIGFPDMDALNAWYSSDGYQALAEVREAAADWTFTSYNVPS